jgi:DNA-binding NarL/FixJ family response regulator
MRILIADDNPAVRHGIADLLEQEEWHICGEASNGAETFQKAGELHPDVVVVDVMMPGTGGLEAARLLRAQNPAIKIVIISEHDPNLLVSRAIQAGADACVDKAWISRDLVPTIKGVTGSASYEELAS